MFEKIVGRTATTLYALTIGVVLIWFAWLLLTSLPLWAAVLGFCLVAPLLMLVAGPVAAAGAGLAGVIVGLLALISAAVARRVRHAG